jgi:hypothetical protein
MRSALLFAPDQSEHRKVNADERQDQPHRADGGIGGTMKYEEVQGSGVVVIPLATIGIRGCILEASFSTVYLKAKAKYTIENNG